MRRANSRIRAIIAATFAATISSARADVASSPPSDCPPDTFPDTNHGGSGCAPATCPPGSSGTICEEGPCCAVVSCETADQLHCDQGTCQEVRLCVQPGMIVGFAAHHEPVKRALGRCNEDGSTCPSGSACETLRACVGARFPARGSFIVLPPEEPAPSHRRGLLAVEAAMTVFVVLVVVGFLVAGRQRRRRT